jgi:hypothetical protein
VAEGVCGAESLLLRKDINLLLRWIRWEDRIVMYSNSALPTYITSKPFSIIAALSSVLLRLNQHAVT